MSALAHPLRLFGALGVIAISAGGGEAIAAPLTSDVDAVGGFPFGLLGLLGLLGLAGGRRLRTRPRERAERYIVNQASPTRSDDS